MELVENSSSMASSMAAVPLLSVAKVLLAGLSFIAGALFAVATVLVALVILPVAVVMSVFIGPRHEKGRQGWRPVPA